MLSAERHERILEQLEQNKSVKVSEISRRLGVTEKTIRLDLEYLEQCGLLKRIHGGAVQMNRESMILPVNERQSSLSDVKSSIAREAKKLIKPNETILLDGGSTTLALARQLGDFPVTVITNDVQIAYVLLGKSNVQLMLLGGTQIGSSSSLLGELAVEALKRIRVSRLFFGATGVSAEYGLTVLNSLHADWKRRVIQSSEQVTLLADSTKFERTALIQFARLEELDEIISDSNLEDRIVKLYEAKGIRLIKANIG